MKVLPLAISSSTTDTGMGPNPRSRIARLRWVRLAAGCRQAELAIPAAGNGGDRHQGVAVEEVEQLMRRRLAAQNDQAAPDRVQHAPEVDAILGISVQV